MEYFKSVCQHDCPDTCALLVGVENGRIVKVKGNPEHPFTRGDLCVKVNHYAERINSPMRILSPRKRIGPKGSGRFEPITWDEALDEVAAKYGKIIKEYGAEAILPYYYAGTMGHVQRNAGHAFFNKLGASVMKPTICSAAAGAGLMYSLGNTPNTDIESTVDSDLIIIWGQNTITTNIHAWPFYLEARKNNRAPIVVIDPYRNLTARKADHHLMIKPGTDAALALGIMHVLIKEDLIDREYLDRWTVGFEKLNERIHEYSPEIVQDICGIEAELIVKLGLMYGRARAPFISLGMGPARQLKGGMAARTIALLPALVGAYHKKGGGFTKATSAAFEMDLSPLTRPDLRPPRTRTINMVELGRALNGLNDPPIKALHVYHCNPAVVAPDSAKVMAGLMRDDLFMVVHEMFPTETALWADLILPGASCLETTDLYGSYGHYYLQFARPVVPPLGESHSNLSIFQDLAERFGFTEEVFKLNEEELIKRILPINSPYFEGLSFRDLDERGWVRMNLPDNPFDDGFKTPSGKIEIYSKAMEQVGLDPLPSGEISLDPDGINKYPLNLITPPKHEFLNSSFNEIQSLQEKAGPPKVMINPVDAADRNLENDEVVRVFNDRGECHLEAHLTENVRPGLVVIEGLYWPRFMPMDRGVNQLTSQRLTDMGETCAFHCNLVEVEARVSAPST